MTMKIEDHASRDFVSDDARIGILVELLGNAVVHITLARKGSSGSVELTQPQLEQLSELIPAAAEYVRGLRATEAQG